MEFPRIELGQVDDERDGHITLVGREAFQFGIEGRVAEGGEGFDHHDY